jgi:(R,R)-butanediol dehydrogenase/meso-butanediol dehydrogenase/diacetyl reductase
VSDSDRVIVLGTGGIGSFITFAASSTGADVTVVDLNPGFEAGNPDLDRLLSDQYSTVVFECSARPESLQRALSAVSKNGRVVVVGHQPAPVAVDFQLVAMGEREMIGTMAHAFGQDFPQAVDLIASDPEVWVAVAPTVFPLEDVVTAGLRPMVAGKQTQIKPLFDPSLAAPCPIRVRN